MYILLSSSSRPRYQQDILRALAAPVGATIQFRYAKKLVTEELIQSPKDAVGQDAMVCHVDLECNEGQTCPLVPIRKVKIKSINTHGTTLSIRLTIGDFVHQTSEVFTEDIRKMSNGETAARTSENGKSVIRGSFFFKVTGSPRLGKRGRALDVWESTCREVDNSKSFEHDSYYWTTVKLISGEGNEFLNCNSVQSTPEVVHFNKTYTLLVYVFHPGKDSWDPVGEKLILKSNYNLDLIYPNDVTVDSPYDLKRWSFKLTATDYLFKKNGWLNIGPAKKKASSDKDEEDRMAWDIIIPFKTSLSIVTLLMVSGLLGLAISLPSMAILWTKSSTPPTPTDTKVLSSLFSFIAGSAASFLAILGIKKMWLK